MIQLDYLLLSKTSCSTKLSPARTLTHLRDNTGSHKPCKPIRYVSGVCLACAYKLSQCFHLRKMSNVRTCDGNEM